MGVVPSRGCNGRIAGRAGPVDDQRQDLLDLEGRRDRAAELGERLGLLTARGIVGEQSRVVNRHRGVVGEAEQDLLVAVGQDAIVAVGDCEKALDVFLDLDRYRHVRPHAFFARRRREMRADPRVLEIALRAEGEARREDLSARALAGRDAERGIALVARTGPLAEDDGIDPGIAKRDGGHVAPTNLTSPLGDTLEHGREVERGVDGLDCVGEQLGLALTTARFFVEARVLDSDGRLVGQEPGEILFFGREAAPVAERHDQRADRAIAVDQRQGDARVEIARLGERAVAPAGILLHVLEVLRPA